MATGIALPAGSIAGAAVGSTPQQGNGEVSVSAGLGVGEGRFNPIHHISQNFHVI